MADTSVDRLFFELGIDPSGMAAGAAKAQGIFGSLSKRAKVTIGILGGFTAVFAAIATKSVFAASKFQDAFNEVRTLIDETTTDSQQLRKEVLKLAVAVGRPPEEVSRGLYQVISAGVTDAAEAMDVLEIATRASIGGLTDQFTAVDAVTTVLNAYNLEASEAENVTDLMLNAVKEGKLTFSDLAANIGLVVTTAAQAGVGFDEVSAALASMTKAGLSTEIAVTALNNLILRIVVPQDDAAKAAKRMGVEFGEAALKSKGLTGIMSQMAKAADGSITKFAEMLPEIRGMRAGTVLAGSGFEEFVRIMETTKDVTGTTQEFFVKIKQSMSETAKEISARLNVAFIKLGTKILPAVTGTLEGILDLLDRFTKTDIQRQVDALEKITGTQALVRRLLLTERIELEEEKRIANTERLNSLIKDGGRELLVNQNISLKTGTIVNEQAEAERTTLKELLKIVQSKDAINKLSQIESDLVISIGEDQIKIGEARTINDDKSLKFAQDQQNISKDNLVKVRELLLLLAQESESKEAIKKAEEEILALLGDQGEQETKNKNIKEGLTKSITEQQEELKNQIRIVEEGAAAEIALIELTGKIEKQVAGEIRAEVAEIRNVTIDRLNAHLKQAIIVYGKESQFVKDLKVAIARLRLEAQEEISVSFKGDLILRGIDQASRAIAGLSTQILGLGSSGELTIRRIGDMAGGLLDLRKAFRNSESDILSKIIPALGLFTTGLSLLGISFNQGKSAAEKLADETRRLAEEQERLTRAFKASLILGNLSDAEKLREELERLLADPFVKDILLGDPDVQREEFKELFGDELTDAFFDLFDLIRDALADEIITPEEATAIDEAIAAFSQIQGASGFLAGTFLDIITSVDALTSSMRAAAEAAAAAAKALQDEADAAAGEDLLDLLFGRQAMISDEGIDAIDGTAREPTPATRDFRQFVGITEIQGSLLLGILNTQTDIARQQLNLFQNNLAGIGGIGSITIDEFNFAVNIENVDLTSDQNIQDVSELLALETVDAMRAIGQ